MTQCRLVFSAPGRPSSDFEEVRNQGKGMEWKESLEKKVGVTQCADLSSARSAAFLSFSLDVEARLVCCCSHLSPSFATPSLLCSFSSSLSRFFLFFVSLSWSSCPSPSSAPLPAYLAEFLRVVCSFHVIEALGMTETSGGAMCSVPGDNTLGMSRAPEAEKRNRNRDWWRVIYKWTPEKHRLSDLSIATAWRWVKNLIVSIDIASRSENKKARDHVDEEVAQAAHVVSSREEQAL